MPLPELPELEELYRLYRTDLYRYLCHLTHDPAEALSVLREIEAASHLRATAVVNNTHLAGLTDGEVLGRGVAFAQEVAASAGLPLAFTAVPASALEDVDVPGVRYLVSVHVRKPWE